MVGLRASTRLLAVVLVTITSCSSPSSSTVSDAPANSGPVSSGPPGSVDSSAGNSSDAVTTPCLVAAAGDVAGDDDYQAGAARTAELISAAHPQKVLALGDLAYSDGTAAEFADYYDPTWGALKTITSPTPGNHEYVTDGKGYFDYFDVPGNYAFDLCGWHIVSVDQYADEQAAATFITSEGESAGSVPLLVFWHEPRFSSGVEHGSEPGMQPLWKAAAAAGADIVLNGHDHDYERFDPMDADGAPRADGTVEFVSGNGGHHLRELADREPHSAAAVAGKPGALFLTLRADGYDWTYQDVDGRVGDQGTRQLP